MSVPLHPALVHLPLGLAFVVPVLAVGFSWALWKERIRPRVWLILVASLGVLLAAGLVALKTGQQEAERVEKVAPETAIDTHEEYAEQFLWVTAATLALAGSVLVVKRPGAIRGLATATVLGTVLITGMAIRVGHAGGELVYVHNTGAADVGSDKAITQAETGKEPQAVKKADDDDRR